MMKEKLRDFFLTPYSPKPLAIFRIMLSVVLLWQATWFAGLLLDLFGDSGILQGALQDYVTGTNMRMVRLVDILPFLHLEEAQGIRILFMVYVSSLAALLVGWQTRVASVVACFTHAALTMNGYLSTYGVDQFSQVSLFYLIFAPAGKAFSLDAWKMPVEPSVPARVMTRAFQIHLGIAYLATGLAKARGTQWWNGEAIWRAVMMPEYATFNNSWLAHFPVFCLVAGWGTLLVEIGYPFFIWPRKTRLIWVAATLSLHLGILLMLGLYTFSLVMIALTLCFFGLTSRRWDST